MKNVYYEDEDIQVWLEKHEGQPYIHVGIFNMTKAVLNKIKEKWGEVVISLYFDGYENVFTYTKDSRIVKLIGGANKIGQHKDIEVWQWELK